MTDRILTWHLDRLLGTTEAQGPTFYMEKDYSLGACRFYARVAPGGGDAKVDIRTDGVSLFTSNYATLNKGANLEENAEDYPTTTPEITEGSIVTLHVMETNGAGDITVHLELDTLNDEEGDSE